jgi:hypothetical protein
MSLGRLCALFIAVFSLITLGSSLVVSAYATGTYGSGSYGLCAYGTACSISLTSNGLVSLAVTPAIGGKCTIQSDTASVLTDDTNGYTLTLADNSTNTSLINGSYSIPATSGTFSSPATLTSDSWGYRIDGLGSFGSGPTTGQTNISPGSALFAAIEASNVSPDTLANTSTSADPAVSTTVWYGACANLSVANGTYTTNVTYTALAN